MITVSDEQREWCEQFKTVLDAVPSTKEPKAGQWPRIEHIVTDRKELPELPPVLIEGVLRKGGKMIVTAASKAGKSFLLIELAEALAAGGEWLGMECERCRVLYVNLEIQRAQFLHRAFSVMEKGGYDPEACMENLDIWNLRGVASDIETLAGHLETEAGGYDVVIIDPAYKVQGGIENDADAISRFCHWLDVICQSLGCTVVFSHHHSKGDKSSASAIDRGSGSGVFARDPDAILDLMELELDETARMGRDVRHSLDGATAWRMEFVLRDFGEHVPVDMWWRYPIHEADDGGVLDGCKVLSNPRSSRTTGDSVRRMEHICASLMGDGDEVTRTDLEKAVGVSRNTLKGYVNQSSLFEWEGRDSGAVIRRIAEGCQVVN